MKQNSPEKNADGRETDTFHHQLTNIRSLKTKSLIVLISEGVHT
jgi:hypothetical protein